MSCDLILGTAGHIDHGKTALVKALTGTDTDRLPEEKRRGITIELGFAELVLGPYRLGIVDVPGHERFVRNMLAGATAMDLAMLVVAADESVKPQTREHLEILRLLRLRCGVIALSKCDLPEAEWLDLVEQEVREFVAGTFLADAPIVRTSALSGLGLDQLRGALARAAERVVHVRRDRPTAPFRMAIDRAFAVAGHGTVVTGSVLSGRTEIGDELAVEPGTLRVRVRALQNHGRAVAQVQRGQRAAINLAGVHHEQLGLGHELAAPGYLVPSQRISVRLYLLASAPRPLKNRVRTRLHVGTAELMARVALLDCDALAPGNWAYAQLLLSGPAVTTWGQPFVLRSESPVTTVGGGQVLDPAAPRLRRGQQPALRLLSELWSEDPLVRTAAALYFVGLRPWQTEDLSRIAGVDDARSACQTLIDRGDLVEVPVSPTRTLRICQLVLDELAERIEAVLQKMHEQSPLQQWGDRARLASRLTFVRSQAPGADALLGALLGRMAGAGRVKLSERGVALPGRGPQLSDQQQAVFEQIVATYHQAGFQPPSPQELQAQASRHQAAVPELIRLAVAEGLLVQVGPELYLHAERERQMRETLAAQLAGGNGLTVSQIREMLETTRKYAIPLCEYLDRIGFTRREGDLRVLGERG